MGSNDSFAIARERMVTSIAREPISEVVLQAIAKVKREHFVPRFRATPPNAGLRRTRRTGEWSVEDAEADPMIAAMVYDVDKALGIGEDEHGRTTSTASAPGLMAAMLDILELAPGTRVLEVGTGSGYNAALLAEVVGDPALITTIDIDERLTELARHRLESAGYGGVDVRTGDGTEAVEAPAPFDRVIATVGCVDLAPAWFAQLAPGGFVLVPVQHGGVHPLVKASAAQEDGAMRSKVVGRSGFVAVQGRQAGRASPWPFAGTTGPRRGIRTRPLPPPAAEALAVEPGRERRGGLGRWDLSYYLALVDHRTSYTVAMADATGSSAAVNGDEVWWSGPTGAALADDLIARAVEWIDLGRPRAEEFASAWFALNDPSPHPESGWVVERVDYRQIVTLASSTGRVGASTAG